MPAHVLLVKVSQSFNIFTAHIRGKLEISMIEIFDRHLSLFLKANDLVDISDEMHKFLIVLVFVEWNNWNAVFELIEVRVGCIVDKQHVLNIPILDHPKVLYVNSFFGLPALRAEHPVTYKLPLWIKMV